MRWTKFKRAALIALALAGPAGWTSPARAASWAANADDALLLDVRLGKYRMGDGVRGYATPNGPCVDFADTILALDLPIRLDKQSRRATGWAFDERHTVKIDRVVFTEQIGNISRKVAPDDVIDTPEGWCVKLPALARWLGVGIRADTANALLTVISDKKLAPELAAERKARVPVSQPSFDLAELPHARVAIKGFFMPAVDVVASFAGVRDRKSGSRVEATYELYASGEAGPVAYDARLASDRNAVPRSLRVRAYRTDPAGQLLGPLRATHVAVGDVAGITTPLVAAGSIGPGAVVTNRPVDRPAQFDRMDFVGELPRGWDAELYRNGQLIAFANDRADGRYEFREVALQYGANRFEIVLYGPQGQIRREVQSIPVGLESIPPKQTWYWAGFNEDGRDLIRFGRPVASLRRGWRGALAVERGLDARTSLAANLQSLMLEGGMRAHYLEAALRRAVGPALAELSVAQKVGSGVALRAQALGQLGKTTFGWESIVATGGFTSDRILTGVRQEHMLTFDRSFGTGRNTVPVHLDARWVRRDDGRDRLEGTARASTSLGAISTTGELVWARQTERIGPTAQELHAGLLASGRLGRVRVRGELRYELQPSSRFDSATVVGEWNAGGSLLDPAQWRVEAGYERKLGRARLGAGYIRRFDRLALNASAEVASDGSVAATLSVAFSLGRDPRGGVRMSSEKLAARGTALVRVFRDGNGDGRRQPGEAWEKDVQVAAGRIPVSRLTDAQGQVVIDGLEPFRPVLLGVDGSSLPDPYVQPSTVGLVVTPRPGIAQVIDLPLVAAGEVDGTLVKAGGATLGGVDLELLDVEGRVVKTTRSEYDGFFLFEGVPYGRYQLRVAGLSASAAGIGQALRGDLVVGAKVPSLHLGAVAAAPVTRVAAK